MLDTEDKAPTGSEPLDGDRATSEGGGGPGANRTATEGRGAATGPTVTVTTTTGTTDAPQPSFPAAASPMLRAFHHELCELSRRIRDEEEHPPWVIGRLFRRQVQHEDLLARYVGLCPALAKANCANFTAQAIIGVKLLGEERLKASARVLEDLEFQTSTPAALSYVMRGVFLFIRGVAVIVLIGIYGYSAYKFVLQQDTSILPDISQLKLAPGTAHVLAATAFGMLGSVVSILLRIGDFEVAKGRSKMFLTLTGATLPITGGAFAAFVAAVLSAGVVTVQPTPNAWFFVALGFLAGFSERFSRNFIKLAEDRFGGGEPAAPRNTRRTAVGTRTRVAVVAPRQENASRNVRDHSSRGGTGGASRPGRGVRPAR